LERLVSTGWALVLIGIGYYILLEYRREYKKDRAERDIVFAALWPFKSPVTGVGAILLGLYVIVRDVTEWLHAM
jgi:hypothetical protein